VAAPKNQVATYNSLLVYQYAAFWNWHPKVVVRFCRDPSEVTFDLPLFVQRLQVTSSRMLKCRAGPNFSISFLPANEPEPIRVPLGPYFFYYYDEYKWIECCMDRCRRSVPGLPLFPYYSAPSYTKGQLVDWGRKLVRYGLAICQLSVSLSLGRQRNIKRIHRRAAMMMMMY
jgi:hypothetical protein